jgi:hypothetical protein
MYILQEETEVITDKEEKRKQVAHRAPKKQKINGFYNEVFEGCYICCITNLDKAGQKGD